MRWFRANPESPVFPELKSLVAKTFGIADVVRESLQPFARKVVAAFIYGSVARGKHDASSDVDLLVVGDIAVRRRLLRPGMATALDNLVVARQLKAEPSSPAEIDALLKRAAGLLTDAGNAALSPVSRFTLAYDAAFALATASLHAIGRAAAASCGTNKNARRLVEWIMNPTYKTRLIY